MRSRQLLYTLGVVSSSVGVSAAFVPSPADALRRNGRGVAGPHQRYAGKDDLRIIAEQANPIIGFYDPLQIADVPIYQESQEASIAFLRHSEIKHGRVAMAAFVGFIAQANGIRFPWPLTMDGESFPESLNCPPAQWADLPEWSKWQIILFIGFLDMWSEMAGVHYMRGGQPGKFPDFTAHPDLILHPVPFNLYDPLGWHTAKSAADRERGLICELNNGRLAMIGIMSLLSECVVPGSVPFLSQFEDFPAYDGNIMAPFNFQ